MALPEDTWTKSTRSQGASNCVEVYWTKSTHSAHNGNCVEVRREIVDHQVLVRNSKRPDAGTVAFTASEWEAFIAGAKDGEFDLA